jgi:uncharacterized membrane protein YccC
MDAWAWTVAGIGIGIVATFVAAMIREEIRARRTRRELRKALGNLMEAMVSAFGPLTVPAPQTREQALARLREHNAMVEAWEAAQGPPIVPAPLTMGALRAQVEIEARSSDE